MRISRFILLLFVLVAGATAQSVDQLRQSFDQRCGQAATLRDEQLAKLNQAYQTALERLLEKIKGAGNLDAALPIHAEIEAIKQADAKLPPLSDNAGELKPLRTKYLDNRQQILKAHATALGGLADKMEAALKAQEAELTKAGKITDAIAARTSREELAQDSDVREARDLLKVAGGGKGRAVLQLRRFGDNLEVLVYHDRLGKLSMDSPVENIREKTGDGKELGDTKATVLGAFVGAKGYAVDSYVAYHQVFDGKDAGPLSLTEIQPGFRVDVEKTKGMKLAFKPGATNPHGSFGLIAPPNAAKGTLRISARYFIPKSNRALAGFQFVQGAGGPIGGLRFEETGKWTTGEVTAESNHETGTLILYLTLTEGRKLAAAADDFIVLGELKVEHLKFTAFVQQRFGDSGKPESEQTDPLKQPVFISNGEFAAKP